MSKTMKIDGHEFADAVQFVLTGVGCLVLGYALTAVLACLSVEQNPGGPLDRLIAFAFGSAAAVTMALCFIAGRHLLLLAWGMR